MDWTVSVSCIYALLIKREVRWMDIGQNASSFFGVFMDQNEVEVYKNPKPGQYRSILTQLKSKLIDIMYRNFFFRD